MTGISRKLVLACLLTFVGTSISILVQTYSSMVFLSSYSANKIPYLFLTSGISSMIFSQLLKNAMGRNYYGVSLKIHFIFVAILLPFIGILGLPSMWVPFFFAVLLLTMYGFSATVFGTFGTSPFNLREFKAVGSWLPAFGALGGVTWGLLVPVILKIFHPISLLWLIITLYLMAILLMRLLKKEVVASQSKVVADTVVSHLFRHPLVISVFVIFIFSVVISTFADYSLKSLLAQFNQSKIGDILAPFYAITNLVAMLCQFFVSPQIVKRYGVFGLLYSFPIAVFIGSLLLIIYPALSVMLLFGMMVFSTQYAFFYQGRQMVTNVLPDSIRTMTGYQLQSLGKNFATGLAALLLIPIGFGGLRVAALSLILGSAALFFYLSRLNREYKVALKDSINFHRFNVDYLSLTETDEHMLFQQANIALTSEHPDVQLFGFELLKSAHLTQVPEILYLTLNSRSVLVRRNALKVIDHIRDPNSLPILKTRLDSEKNSHIMWSIIRAILKIDAKILLAFAKSHQNSDDPYLRCGIICIFLKSGDIDELLFALENFKNMIHDPRATVRMVACEVLQHIRVGDLSSYLIILLNDRSHRVVRHALKVARGYGTPEVIDVILSKLSYKQMFLSISNTVVILGPVVIPALVCKIERHKKARLIPKEINLLSRIQGEEADHELLHLLDHPDRRIQGLTAHRLAYRAIRLSESQSDHAAVLRHIHDEVHNIQKFMELLELESDQDIQSEIKSRIWFIQKKYLNLIIAYTENEFLLELSPTLLYGDKSQLVYLKSLELLEMGIHDNTMVATIEYALEGKHLPLSSTEDSATMLADPWIDQLIAFKNGKITEKHTMDIINKVLILRKVALFKHLTAESLEHIAGILTVVDLPPGQVIFKEGDFANGLYIVAKGQVEITKDNAPLKTCQPTDFFGELALLDHEPRTATAVASSNSLLYLLSKEDFNRVTDDIPEILKVIVQTIMTYLRPYLIHH